MPEEWKELITYLFIRMAIKQIVVTILAYHFVNHVQTFNQTSCCQVWFHMQRKLLEIIIVNVDATDELLIIYSAFFKYLRNNGNKMN